MKNKVDIEHIENELNEKAKFYSNYLWNRKYNGYVSIKKDMRTVFGYYVNGDVPLIQLSNKMVSTQNELFIDDVLLHELTHWYCEQVGEDNRDGKADFENRLKEHGILPTKTASIHRGRVTVGGWKGKEYIKVPYSASETITKLNKCFHSHR